MERENEYSLFTVDSSNDLDVKTLGREIPDKQEAITAIREVAEMEAGTVTWVSGNDSVHGLDCTKMMTFDLETCPDDTRMALFGLDPVPCSIDPTAFNKMDKPEIFLTQFKSVPDVQKAIIDRNPCLEWIDALLAFEVAATHRASSRKTLTDYLEKLAGGVDKRQTMLCTNPRYARITALGLCIGLEGTIESLVATHEDLGIVGDCTEKDMLKTFWGMLDPDQEFGPDVETLCGFNVLGFDLPLIFYRSMVLGVRPTRSINLSTYANNADVIDTFARFPGFKGQCKQVCLELGIEPKSKMQGHEAPGAYREGRLDDLREYVMSDVYIERELFKKGSGLFWA